MPLRRDLWLRGGARLDKVRRLLDHESLNTPLRYSNLVGAGAHGTNGLPSCQTGDSPMSTSALEALEFESDMSS